MFKKIIVSFLALLIMLGVAHADNSGEFDDKLPELIKKQLSEKYKINRIYYWSAGKLDDRDADYYAVVSGKGEKLKEEEQSGDFDDAKLFLFVEQNGQLKKVLESKHINQCVAYVRSNPCAAEIRKKSLFVTPDYIHGGYCTGNYTTKQYKKIHGSFVLIGEESVDSDCDSQQNYYEKISTNYLTKKSITTKGKYYGKDGEEKKLEIISEKTTAIKLKKLKTLEEDYGQ